MTKKQHDRIVRRYAMNKYNSYWNDKEDRLSLKQFDPIRIIENDLFIGYEVRICNNSNNDDDTYIINKDTLEVFVIHYYDDIINEFINTKIEYLNDDYDIPSYLSMIDLYLDEDRFIRELKYE